jgi:DUF4097 and DUF4098 domain-containing protein YvlB
MEAIQKNTVILSVLFCISVIIPSTFAYGDTKVIQEKSFPTSAGKQLKIETSSGDIEVTTWDKNEVYVKIWGNKKAEEKMRFSFENRDGNIEIYGKKSGSSFFGWNNNINVKYEVKVPRRFYPSLKTSGGNISVINLKGNPYFRTSGGDIHVDKVEGDINGETSGGNINIGQVKGNTKLSTSGGEIHAKWFEGNLDVHTSGGNISIAGQNGRVNANTSGGDVKLFYQGQNKGITLETSGGNIGIFLPADFGANAHLSTSGGDISCELNTSNVVKITSSKFEANLNNGGAELIARTSGGDVRVKKK